jgi:rhodanese-related sulfurtransferase
MSAALNLSFANTSRHLQILRRARLVQSQRRGKQVRYRLANDREVVASVQALGRAGERNFAEIERVVFEYFRARDSLEPLSREELLRRINHQRVMVIDLRSEAEFAIGHLPGALNIPFNELERRLTELPKNEEEIVAYCRGLYCVLSFEAVALLRAKGYNIRRLQDGFPEWRAAGPEIEAAA